MTRVAARLLALGSLVLVPVQWGSAQSGAVHAPDGGTREMIMSIAIPPIANAPFAATVRTEWTKNLENGATQILRNHRLVARDAQGRVFQERRFFAANDQPQTRLTQTEIADPIARTLTVCNPTATECQLRVLSPQASNAVEAATAAGNRNIAGEKLGTQLVDGLELIGSRETTTLNAGVAGTDRPLSIVKEFWYSPRLRINISTRRADPRSGVEVFTVTDITLGEPDAALFLLPPGAHVLDYRAAVRKNN